MDGPALPLRLPRMTRNVPGAGRPARRSVGGFGVARCVFPGGDPRTPGVLARWRALRLAAAARRSSVDLAGSPLVRWRALRSTAAASLPLVPSARRPSVGFGALPAVPGPLVRWRALRSTAAADVPAACRPSGGFAGRHALAGGPVRWRALRFIAAADVPAACRPSVGFGGRHALAGGPVRWRALRLAGSAPATARRPSADLAGSPLVRWRALSFIAAAGVPAACRDSVGFGGRHALAGGLVRWRALRLAGAAYVSVASPVRSVACRALGGFGGRSPLPLVRWGALGRAGRWRAAASGWGALREASVALGSGGVWVGGVG